MRVRLDGDFAVLAGAFSAFVVDLFLEVDPRKRKSWKLSFSSPSFLKVKAVSRVQVSTVSAGLKQGSGRVDVPDGTKIEAAAASPGTSRFQPWTKIQLFLRGLGGNTRDVRCVGSDTMHEAVGHVHGDIYMTLGSHVIDFHDTPLCN